LEQEKKNVRIGKKKGYKGQSNRNPIRSLLKNPKIKPKPWLMNPKEGERINN